MPNSSSGWYKATIWRRFFAVFIDGLIVGLGVFVLNLFVPQDSSGGSIVQTLATFAGWIYAVLFIWKTGATPGKQMMGIKVVRTDGHNLSLWQAFLREVIGKFISGLVFMLGYLWVLWDKNRQAWHDHIAGSYVVTKIPNDGKNPGCLVMLIIGAVAFIPVVAIIAAVVVLAINPLELTRQSRDAARFSDGAVLAKAINDEYMANQTDLCTGTAPCVGMSHQASTALDGTGWVKMVLPASAIPDPLQKGPMLPSDPVNNTEYFYTYCSDGTNWEINFKLESDKYQEKLVQDEGDSDQYYEVGSDKTLCK